MTPFAGSIVGENGWCCIAFYDPHQAVGNLQVVLSSTYLSRKGESVTAMDAGRRQWRHLVVGYEQLYHRGAAHLRWWRG